MHKTRLFHCYFFILVAVSIDFIETRPTVKGMKHKEQNEKHSLEYLWPNGIVHYYIHTNVGEGTFELNGASYKLIKESMSDIERVSCVRFVEHVNRTTINNDVGSLVILAGHKCATSIGYQRGQKALFLIDKDESNPNTRHCMHKKIIIHELLHVLGFSHEHERKDRDQHIIIKEENIRQDAKQLFNITNDPIFPLAAMYNTSYDPTSIMHYGSYAYSKDEQKKKTIIWRKNHTLTVGGSKMSDLDIKKLNTYYRCKDFPTLSPPVKPSKKVLEQDRGTGKRIVRRNTKSYFCPKDICTQNGKLLNGIVKHVQRSGYYADCYFGAIYGCYKCRKQYEFNAEAGKCLVTSIQ